MAADNHENLIGSCDISVCSGLVRDPSLGDADFRGLRARARTETSGDGSPDMPPTQSPYTPHATNLSTNEPAEVAMRRDRQVRTADDNSGMDDEHDSDGTPKLAGKRRNIMNNLLVGVLGVVVLKIALHRELLVYMGVTATC